MSSRRWNYAGCGLAIDSAVQLPELPERRSGDLYERIRIRTGTVARGLPEGATAGGLFETSPDRFLLSMDGVARYLVSDGTRIAVDPEGDEASVRLFLLGSVFGALLHQRGVLPLHASAIETGRGAVVFAGGSGAGKSALAGAFHRRGYRVLADEICAIDCSSGRPMVFPAFPRLLLWPDVMDQLSLRGKNVRLARPGLEKYHVPVEEGWSSEPVPLYSIYIVRVISGSDFELLHVAGAEKVRRLVDMTFRRRFLSGMVSGKRHFEQVNAVTNSTAISRLARPLSRTLRETADLLEKDFTR